MSIVLRPGHFVNNVAFKGHDSSAGSYAGSAVKGAIGGGVVGLGAAALLEKAMLIELPADKLTLSKVQEKTQNLIGTKPYQKIGLIGAGIGLVAMLLNQSARKQEIQAAESLKPIS